MIDRKETRDSGKKGFMKGRISEGVILERGLSRKKGCRNEGIRKCASFTLILFPKHSLHILNNLVYVSIFEDLFIF